MADALTLRDFLYLDLQRVASIYSQLTGGLVTGVETSTERGRDERNIRRYDLKVFKPEFGGATTSGERTVENRVMHHDLYAQMESALFDAGLAVDINERFSEADATPSELVEQLRSMHFIRANGWTVLEDYERLKSIAQKFNDIAGFIRQTMRSSLEDSAEYKTAKSQIEEMKATVRTMPKDQRTKSNIEIKRLETELEKTISNLEDPGHIEDWLVDGIARWIDTFMQGIVNLRLYPFEKTPAFHILGNLKREGFIDDDPNTLNFAYSTRPTVKLTMVGVITSIPFPEGHPFDPMAEFDGVSEEDIDPTLAMERGFRQVFRGFDGFEAIIRTARYPTVTIYPIAVYRDVTSK